MELEYLDLNIKQIASLKNKGLENVEKLIRFLPLHYNDYSQITGVLPPDQISVLVGILKNIRYINNKNQIIQADFFNNGNENDVYPLVWINVPYVYEHLMVISRKQIVVAGKMQFNRYYGKTGFVNPVLCTDAIDSAMKVTPVYSKIANISQSKMWSVIHEGLSYLDLRDFYDDVFVRKFGLMPLQEALFAQHCPENMHQISQSMERLMFDDMLYFTLLDRQLTADTISESPFKVIKTDMFSAIINDLPYNLTEDQNQILMNILERMRTGKRVNGLIQGDVSCGKSIVCFLLAVLMADNGYQTAIMTPNKVLAQQHYTELCELVGEYGLSIEFYADSSKMKASQRKDILKRLSNGEIDIIVGTTSLIGDSIKYQHLALTIVDEEHKFGVVQREALAQKGKKGIHTLLMSATPIPRTMAKTIYNKSMELYSIHSMPNGRKRVLNTVTNNFPATFRFMKKELQKGHQAYVVCPMIEKNKKVKGVLSAEELFQYYNNFLEPFGFKTAVLHGKMKKSEIEEAVEDFKNNKIQLLIATSVIEVGVNVPNATLIVIHNSERFGLAALHQLRGRVGRGSDQAYCAFFSNNLENERLKIISTTNDGFEIAQKDLEMREPGDLLRGIRQSGKNKYIELILTNQTGYKKVTAAADWLEEHDLATEYLKRMESSESFS